MTKIMGTKELENLIINCECEGSEYLKLLVFDYDDDYPCIYFNIDGAEIFSLKDKLKTMWEILWRGECKNYGLLIKKDDINRMTAWLTEAKKRLDPPKKTVGLNK